MTPGSFPGYILSVICPSCSRALEEGAPECPACGLVLAKWKARQDAPKPPSPATAGVVGPARTVIALLAVCGGIGLIARKSLPPASHTAVITSEHLEFVWPPVPGQPYPDLKLQDEEGRPVSLSQFKGKIILLEPTAMTCPACQAFSGGNRPGIGGFAGGAPQSDLVDIEEGVDRYAGGASLHDPNVVFVQLMLYNLNNQAPSAEEVRKWRDHFKLRQRYPGMVFMVADPRMVGAASYDMIPGFHLIDRDFRFVKDASGHRPRNNLWTELLPELGRLAQAG